MAQYRFNENAREFHYSTDYYNRTYVIDKGHLDNPAMGNIYFDKGKLMLQPLILPNDRFNTRIGKKGGLFGGKEYDVTEGMEKPIELHGEMEQQIIEVLEGLDLPIMVPDYEY